MPNAAMPAKPPVTIEEQETHIRNRGGEPLGQVRVAGGLWRRDAGADPAAADVGRKGEEACRDRAYAPMLPADRPAAAPEGCS